MARTPGILAPPPLHAHRVRLTPVLTFPRTEGLPMPTIPVTPLTALSPLDGRYARQLHALRRDLSEFGLIRHRIAVEIAWLLQLAETAEIDGIRPFSSSARATLQGLVETFAESDADRVKAIEGETNHDVKAIEYWLKEKVAGNAELEDAVGFIHFACTSEDINNLAYALMVRNARPCDRSAAWSCAWPCMSRVLQITDQG